MFYNLLTTFYDIKRSRDFDEHLPLNMQGMSSTMEMETLVLL